MSICPVVSDCVCVRAGSQSVQSTVNERSRRAEVPNGLRVTCAFALSGKQCLSLCEKHLIFEQRSCGSNVLVSNINAEEENEMLQQDIFVCVSES